MQMMEQRVRDETGHELPEPRLVTGETELAKGSWMEIWRGPYLGRTVVLIAYNLLQTIGSLNMSLLRFSALFLPHDYLHEAHATFFDVLGKISRHQSHIRPDNTCKVQRICTPGRLLRSKQFGKPRQC